MFIGQGPTYGQAQSTLVSFLAAVAFKWRSVQAPEEQKLNYGLEVLRGLFLTWADALQQQQHQQQQQQQQAPEGTAQQEPPDPPQQPDSDGYETHASRPQAPFTPLCPLLIAFAPAVAAAAAMS